MSNLCDRPMNDITQLGIEFPIYYYTLLLVRFLSVCLSLYAAPSHERHRHRGVRVRARLVFCSMLIWMVTLLKFSKFHCHETHRRDLQQRNWRKNMKRKWKKVKKKTSEWKHMHRIGQFEIGMVVVLSVCIRLKVMIIMASSRKISLMAVICFLHLLHDQ